jgi:hypothetical protein
LQRCATERERAQRRIFERRGTDEVVLAKADCGEQGVGGVRLGRAQLLGEGGIDAEDLAAVGEQQMRPAVAGIEQVEIGRRADHGAS